MNPPRLAARSELLPFTFRHPLGRTGLTVSPYCIGIVADYRVIHEAFERGINFFFVTADMHWPHYEATRRGISDLLRSRPSARDEIVVAATSYVADPDFAVAPFHEVIDNIPGLERLDVTVVGGTKDGHSERFRTFRDRRDAGAIPGARAIGGSFHDHDAAVYQLGRDEIDIGFIRYSSAHRSAESGLFPRVGAQRHPLLFSFKAGRGFVDPERITALGFASDIWRPRWADHYRFVLTRPEIDGCLFSPETVQDLDGIEAALKQGPLSPDETSYMALLSDLNLGRVRLRQVA